VAHFGWTRAHRASGRITLRLPTELSTCPIEFPNPIPRLTPCGGGLSFSCNWRSTGSFMVIVAVIFQEAKFPECSWRRYDHQILGPRCYLTQFVNGLCGHGDAPLLLGPHVTRRLPRATCSAPMLLAFCWTARLHHEKFGGNVDRQMLSYLGVLPMGFF
jgi:hypothetical protein